ncbi:MAG: hypothetical protein V1668_00125 [Patescibacteria group bacterium]
MARDPFGGGQERMIIVPSVRQHRQQARIGLAGSTIGVALGGRHQGKVAIPCWRGSKSADLLNAAVRVTQYRLVSDIYTALRQVDHVLSGYNDQGLIAEKERLYQAVSVARQLYDELLGLKVETLDAKAGAIRECARQVIDHVGRKSSDSFKKAIRGSAVSILSVLDSRKRVNQSAKLAQVVRIRQGLYRRLVTIQAMEPNLFRRLHSFRLLIEEAERLFGNVSGYLSDNLGCLYCRQKLTQVEQGQLVTALQEYAYELERLDIRPFLNPCRRLANELRKGAYYISVGRNHAAQTVLHRAEESLKIRGIRSDIERFISYLTELLYRPHRLIPSKDLGRIKRGLNDLRCRIGRIDEYRFIHPVCSRALMQLIEAISIAKNLTFSSQIGDLAHLKGKLKETARGL